MYRLGFRSLLTRTSTKLTKGSAFLPALAGQNRPYNIRVVPTNPDPVTGKPRDFGTHIQIVPTQEERAKFGLSEAYGQSPVKDKDRPKTPVENKVTIPGFKSFSLKSFITNSRGFNNDWLREEPKHIFKVADWHKNKEVFSGRDTFEIDMGPLTQAKAEKLKGHKANPLYEITASDPRRATNCVVELLPPINAIEGINLESVRHETPEQLALRIATEAAAKK